MKRTYHVVADDRRLSPEFECYDDADAWMDCFIDAAEAEMEEDDDAGGYDFLELRTDEGQTLRRYTLG